VGAHPTWALIGPVVRLWGAGWRDASRQSRALVALGSLSLPTAPEGVQVPKKLSRGQNATPPGVVGPAALYHQGWYG